MPSTYESALDQLRTEWLAHPNRRAEIEARAAGLIREHDGERPQTFAGPIAARLQAAHAARKAAEA